MESLKKKASEYIEFQVRINEIRQLEQEDRLRCILEIEDALRSREQMTDLEVGDNLKAENEQETKLISNNENLVYDGIDEKIAFIENSKVYDPSSLIRDVFRDL